MVTVIPQQTSTVRLGTPRRSGWLLTMELLLILPLLMLVLSAMVQLSVMSTARSRITHAATAIAYQLSQVELTATQIQTSLRAALGPQLASGAVAEVVLPDTHRDLGRLTVKVRLSHAVPQLPGHRLITGGRRWLVVDVPIVRPAMDRAAD